MHFLHPQLIQAQTEYVAEKCKCYNPPHQKTQRI